MTMFRVLAVIGVLWPGISFASSRHANAAHPFTQPRLLLLRSTLLPRHYLFVNFTIFHSLQTWDSGIEGVMAVDRSHEWIGAAQQMYLDPLRFWGGLGVSIFRSPRQAAADFALLYTPRHPFTRFVVGEQWLRGRGYSGLGAGIRATNYTIAHSHTSCPQHHIAGLAFVFRNAVFNVEMCAVPVGSHGVLDVGRRVVRRARWVLAHPGAGSPRAGR